jgi:hypothetical protein
MSVPGFDADMTLYDGKYYRSVAPASWQPQGVIPQLRIGGGGGLGGGLGFHWPSWCEISCAAAAAACNIACVGAAIGYPACVAACSTAEIACLVACNSHGVFAA